MKEVKNNALPAPMHVFKVGVVLAYMALCLTAYPRVMEAKEKETKDFPGLDKPQILCDLRGNESSGYFGSLAFTQDGASIVGTFRRDALRGLARLLGQGENEVRSFGLDAKKEGTIVIIKAPNTGFAIVTTPSGRCRDPLILASRRFGYAPKEVTLVRIADGESRDRQASGNHETVMGRYSLTGAENKNDLYLAPSGSIALDPSGETLVLGRAWYEWKKGKKEHHSPNWESDLIDRGDLKTFDLKTGKVRFTDAWDTDGIADVAWSADGKSVAAGGGHSTSAFLGYVRSYDGRVACWTDDFQNKRFDLALPHHQVECLSFSPDNQVLAAGGQDGTVTFVDATKGTIVKSLKVAAHSGRTLGRVLALAFSPDGRLLATGTGSYNRGNRWGETFLIDISGCEVYKLPTSSEDGPITCVAFSPNGKFLAAAGQEGLLKIWQFRDTVPSE